MDSLIKTSISSKNAQSNFIFNRNTEYTQLGYLGILRTDYMLSEDNQPKLVELNTIASGLGAVSDKMYNLHEFLIEKYGASNYAAEGEHHFLLKFDIN